MFDLIAHLGNAFCLIILCLLPEGHEIICFLLLTTATAFLGFTSGSFYKAGPLIAQQDSSFVTGNVALGKPLFIWKLET